MSKDKEPKYLYQRVNGIFSAYPFKKGEENEYIDICKSTWGAVPCDVNWAMNSPLYKEQKLKMYEEINSVPDSSHNAIFL